MVTYNDHGTGETVAHANGAILWETSSVIGPRTMGMTAIWVTSSCPSFGETTTNYLFGNCFTKVQHAQCVSFTPSSPTQKGTKEYFSFQDHLGINAIPSGVNMPQLEMVAMHLMYRNVAYEKLKCANAAGASFVPAAYVRIAQICSGNSQPYIHDAKNSYWSISYMFRSTIIMLNLRPMVVFSKKQGEAASLWDDVVMPNLSPPTATWKVSTFFSGDNTKLPAACCNGVAVTIPTSTATSMQKSCRIQCHPLNYQAAYKIVQTKIATDPTICGGFPGSPAAAQKAATVVIQKAVLIAAGDQTAPWSTPAHWKAWFKDACVTPSALTNTGATALKDLTNTALYGAPRDTCRGTVVAVQQWKLVPADITNLPNTAPYTSPWHALSCDHSKIAWSSHDNIVCVGDLNRHGGGVASNSNFGGNLLR
jgi:hypothetical protein